MTETTYAVEGMTCDHCVRAVTDEISGLPGVAAVSVDLVVGGLTTVTVTSEQPLDEASVTDAVTEAGYRLVGPGVAP
jgi:copper chaperone CopZ